MNNQLFSIGEAIKVGWEKAKSNIGSFFLIILGSWIISALVGALSGGAEDTSAIGIIVGLLSWVVALFLQMGITRVVLKVLDGGKAALSDFTSNPERFGKFLLGNLLAGLIIAVGFVLLIIPGIILSIRLQFVPYLIVEKNLGPVDALKRSWEITRGHTWNLFLFGLVCILVVLLGLIALFIGLFWAMPTVLIAVAYVYHKLDRAPVTAAVSVQQAAV